jgi:DNA replication protein DnaC
MINEPALQQLHRGTFIDGADNMLIGSPGTGKIQIAIALGIQAVRHHQEKVRFFATGGCCTRAGKSRQLG